MANQRPKEWVSVVISRFQSQLPSNCAQFTPSSRASLEKNKECLIRLSTAQFYTIISGLNDILKNLANIRIYGERQERSLYTSQIIVLETIEKCAREQQSDTTNLNEAIVIKQLLPDICGFIHRSMNEDPLLCQLQTTASRVLYCLSHDYFQAIFSRVSARLYDLSIGSEDMQEASNLDLIQHIHVDMNRITVILDDVVQRFKFLRKSLQLSLVTSLEKVVWNWLHAYQSDLCALYYPEDAVRAEMQNLHPSFITDLARLGDNPQRLLLQYNSLLQKQKENSEQLSNIAESLFELVSSLCDGSKRKSSACWSLQTMLLVLCPEIIQQIDVSRSSSAVSKHKEFFTNLQKQLSSRNSQAQENALVAFTQLIKAASCVPISLPPQEECSLHKLANNILPEMKNLYFYGSKSNRSQNLDDLTSFIASCIRLHHAKNNLSSICLDADAHPNLKKCYVQALHWIATEHRMHWWPDISNLISIGPTLRALFLETAAKLLDPNVSPIRNNSQSSFRGRVSLRRNHSTEDKSSTIELLTVLVQLAVADQKLFLHNLGSGSQQIHASCWEFVRHLASLVTPVHAHLSWELSLASMAVLLNLHKPEITTHWNPESPAATFWDVSSTMLVMICDQILAEQMQCSAEIASNTLKWLREILAYRISFLLHHQERLSMLKKVEIVNRAERRVEMTLFSHLWSSDMEVVLVALSCFHFLQEEIQVRYNIDESTYIHALPGSCELYRNLANITENIPMGFPTIQDKIRIILKENVYFTPASLEGWEEVRCKWEKRTTSLLNPRKHKPDDSIGDVRTSIRKTVPHEHLTEWINMTGLLCSAGGVCVGANDLNNLNIDMLTDRKLSSSSLSSVTMATTSTHLSSATNLPSKATSVSLPEVKSSPVSECPHPNKSLSKPFEHASRFVERLLSLLSQQDLVKYAEIKNATRNLLATSLHPSLYSLLFLQMKKQLGKMYDPLGQMFINEVNTMFIDYIIFITKNLLANCSEPFTQHLGEESLESIILQLIRYVRHMADSFRSINMKITLCDLITEMMIKRNDLFFVSEVKFRNKIVEYLSNWIMSSSEHEQTNSIPDDAKILLRQLDEAAMSAVVILLQDLPLQPEEIDGGDVAKAKSQLFLKYFTLFMKLLNHCSSNASPVYDADSFLDDSMETNRQLVMLREHTISAMSNLLGANIEQGFVHSAVLAYNPDFATRSAYLEILTKILQQQGTKRFEALKESTLGERFDHLVELVTMMGDGGELPIANALANVVHIMHLDELARVFVTLYDAKHLLYQLLWNMFSKEVKFAENVRTLFRGNSLASKIMTFCFKVYGASYLHNLLEPQVAWALSDEIKSLNFEVDQQRLSEGENITQTRANLQRLTERFFSRIIISTNTFPPQLKSVCHCLYQVVSQRFPEGGAGAVAGAVFLRFLHPAIASPNEFGLTENRLPRNLERGFRLMCKIMQKIANHVLFTKEPHMKHFNDFVHARFDVCQQFFIQISSPESPSNETMAHMMPIISEANIAALHRLLWNNQEKIGVYLSRSRGAKNVGRKPFDKMVTLLAYIGPPEYNRPALETRISGLNITPSEFEEMMTKRKAADTEEFKNLKTHNIFYQSGRSKMGYPVFYYIARRFKTDEMRQDLLMYYIMLAIKPFHMRKFEVIIDLTHVAPDNQFKRDLLPEWRNILPESTYRNLDAVYLYNANSWFAEYVDYHGALFGPISGDNRLHFIDHLDQLNAFIEAEQQKIPLATSGLNDDVTVYFNAISFGHKFHIKIGPQAIQVTSVEKCKVLGHQVSLNDIYYVNEIDDVAINPDQTSFSIKTSTNNSVFTFAHHESDSIVKSICHIRRRWELSRPESQLQDRKITANEIAGTLLNMALLNLGCSNPLVRSSSYNLLCAVADAFELHIEGRLCETDGLCIPSNNTLFIASISSTLAQTESSVTLEFLEECITGFCNSDSESKNLCLEYMEPWLFNLSSFVKNIDENKVKRVIEILHRLIDLTVDEKLFYPSLQTKIWGSIGQMPELIDIVLDAFIAVSAKAGMGSRKAEVMADTSVALAANNMKLVSNRIIMRLCEIVDKTALRPTPSLEKNKHWDDIAILARYLLMLSFNNNLDVTTHMPYLCHLVTLLLHTGPVALRASMHGLVVNIIHSLLTCKQMQFKPDTQKVLQLSLTEFSLPKFYQLFGISNVKSAPDVAFKFDFTQPLELLIANEEQEPDSGNTVDLMHLDMISDFLLEIISVCSKDIINCQWLSIWLQLCNKFAFQYNPSLQPRAIVVLGCISNQSTIRHVKQIMKIMAKSLESNADLTLFQSTVLCFTRLQMVTPMDIETLSLFFWVGVFALHLDDAASYSAGLCLIEQNLQQLDAKSTFSSHGPSTLLLHARKKTEWNFKQLDRVTGINFESHFHFAFACHLLKGFRHRDPAVVSRTIRILNMMLEIIAHNRNCEKYTVNIDNVAYLTALLPWSDDVRRYCGTRVKDGLSTRNNSSNSFNSSNKNSGETASQILLDIEDSLSARNSRKSSESSPGTNIKVEPMRDSTLYQGINQRNIKEHDSDSGSMHGHEPSKRNKSGSSSSGHNICEPSTSKMNRHHRKIPSPTFNVLLDEEILHDTETQTLLLTILATQIRYSSDEATAQILYEYLAEASIVFPQVFPIIHSLLDQNIISLLQDCDNLSMLSDIQAIIHNSLCANQSSMHHNSYLQNIGFGGAWRLASMFPKESSLENVPYIFNLLSEIIAIHFGDVPDLSPVASQQSVNSTLSAVSSGKYDGGECDVVLSSANEKMPGFKRKGPKLTIPII